MGILTDIWESQKKWDELEKERKRKRREEKLRKKQLKNEEVIVDEETGEVIKKESNLIYYGGVLCYKKFDAPEFVEEEPKLKVNGELTERFRIRYSKYLAFVNFVKYIRPKKYFPILTLAQTSGPLLAIRDSQAQVKTALDELQKMKLIVKDSDSYQKGVAGKSYVYIYENEQKLIEYCKRYNIEAYQIKEFEVLTKEEKNKVLDEFKTKSGEDIIALFTQKDIDSDQVFEVPAHPGYVDVGVIENSSLTVGRAWDAYSFLDPVVKEWLENNHIENMDYTQLRKIK